MYNYTFATVPIPDAFSSPYRAYPCKRKQPSSWTTAFLFRRYANNEQCLDEYDASHALVAAEQDLACFRVDNVDDGGVGYESVID